MNTAADVAVIGAGPAGVAAANELTGRGVSVVVIDENQRPGGQIGRLRFVSESDADRGELDMAVDFRGSTVCHGFRDEHAVVVSDSCGTSTIHAEFFIVATGSREVVYPMPGWTLPGVMTAGAAQTFLKGSGALPYRRVLVAGSGPLLLAAATQLVDHGVEVAGVLDASRPRLADWRDAVRLGASPALLAQGADYVVRLARAGVRVRLGHGVASIVGETRVRGATVGALDHDWRFTDTATDFIDCDAVLLCHGFSSVVELVGQSGGQLDWDDRRLDWVPRRDRAFRTTVPHVRAVGDCAGVGGAQIAALEGTLVGRWTADELTGRTADAPGALPRRLRRLERFRLGMDGLFRAGTGAGTWAEPSTTIWRCESVDRADIEGALHHDIDDLHGLKMWSRAGMGACQGRTCTPVLRSLLADRGTSRGATIPPSYRFPVRPLRIAALDGPPSNRGGHDA